jgi:hypothetical protein
MAPIEDLVIAMLAVNNFSLERAYSLRESLDERGLFRLEKLAAKSTSAIATDLEDAGYRRGNFMTPLLAERLRLLAQKVASNPDKFMSAISSTDREAIRQALQGLPGIGPRVVKNYLLLSGR